jgi:hypothetical protein
MMIAVEKTTLVLSDPPKQLRAAELKKLSPIDTAGQLYRMGLVTHRVTTKGFCDALGISSSFPKLSWRKLHQSQRTTYWGRWPDCNAHGHCTT